MCVWMCGAFGYVCACVRPSGLRSFPFPTPDSPASPPPPKPSQIHPKTPHGNKQNQYHPERLLPALEGLPRPFLHERALLLSRLGRHEEVLRLYVEKLGDPALAEGYCEEVGALYGVWMCVKDWG